MLDILTEERGFEVEVRGKKQITVFERFNAVSRREGCPGFISGQVD